MNLTDSQRKLLKWVGYPLLAIVVFVFAIFYTFPYERLTSKIEDSLSTRYKVDIEKIRPGIIPGNVTISGISMRTIPNKPGEKPIDIYVDSVDVSIGILAAITGEVDVDIEAHVGDGLVEASVEVSKAGMEASMDTEMLPLETLPGLQYAVGGLPITGGLNAHFEINLPEGKWSNADGKIEFSCTACTIGDGKSKVQLRPKKDKFGRVKQQAFKEGITVPTLRLGQAQALIEIEKGVANIRTFSARSQDGQLDMDGQILFTDPVGKSPVPGCMRFRLSDEFKNRDKKFASIELMLAKAKQPDGTYALPTKGTLNSLKWTMKRKCKGAADPTASRERPTLDSTPPPGSPPPVAASPPPAAPPAAGAPAAGAPTPAAGATPAPPAAGNPPAIPPPRQPAAGVEPQDEDRPLDEDEFIDEEDEQVEEELEREREERLREDELADDEEIVE